MNPPPYPAPGQPGGWTDAVAGFFERCHQVRLFEVSLAHLFVVGGLMLAVLVIRRLSR